jgi:hypothetical protein
MQRQQKRGSDPADHFPTNSAMELAGGDNSSHNRRPINHHVERQSDSEHTDMRERGLTRTSSNILSDDAVATRQNRRSSKTGRFSKDRFICYMQIILSLVGVYLPRTDKCYARMWEEQILSPLSQIFQGSEQENENENENEKYQGCKWWKSHWFFCRFVNLLQIGFTIEVLLQFSIFDVSLYSYWSVLL